MANALYERARGKFLTGDLSWMSQNIKVVLVDTASYTVNISADEFLSSIPGSYRIATSANLANKTFTFGVADADDITFSAVSGAQSEALVIYRDSGAAATSDLIAYIDTATGLPVTPNGGNITVQWDSGASKIFKL